MRPSQLLAAVALCTRLGYSLDLDVTSSSSIRTAASTLAYGLMSYYKNNQSDTPAASVGTLPSPLYWWEAGAVWGGLIDYWAYTNDTSYNPSVTQALMAQTGTDNNFMPTAYDSSLGNDDQSFWVFAALSALEYGYEDPPEGSPSWLELAENAFNSMAPRWDTSTCGGGLRWQIFSYNAGYDYKNSVSNGGFFQIAARLAHYTGNSTYSDWAERIWTWTASIGLIDTDYRIFDGTSDLTNCTTLDQIQWTYNSGLFLYGAAMLYNYTNASSTWETRVTGLLEQTNQTFFSPYDNATNVMYEVACEPYDTCDTDQYSFKAYLARWLAKTIVVAPYTKSTIQPLLVASAEAAARSCSGPTDGVTCGQKWYTDYDGNYGVGQQLSALEVTQALLIDDAPSLMNEAMAKVKAASSSSTLSSTVSVGAASASAFTGTPAIVTATATATATSSSTGKAPAGPTGMAPVGMLVGGVMMGAVALL